MPDLLIELFSEEIPARMQPRAADDLKRLVTDGLVDAGLTYAHAGAFATPRRLTLAIEGLLDRSPDMTEERKGPKTSAPDKAVDGFLRGAGVTRDQLEIRKVKKDDVYFATIDRPGRPAADIVAEVLERTIRNFPWPKSMRWGDGSLRWVRPLHRILCILSREDGHEIVPLAIDGITAGDVTEGHRFMAPGPIRVTSFDDYAAKLKRAHVVLDPAERADTIRADATNMAFASGLEMVEDAALLAEIAGLVEWPVPLMGRIDDAYLSLPPEVLQTSMREHQKFFSVRDPKSGQITRFITVANRTTADDGATILSGNQRVLSARLADAAFFWENDLRIAKDGMGPWIDNLSSVTFHAKLGSEADRVARIAALARELAPAVGADPDATEQAAKLAKADLTSEMVYEFPELQGIMGRYYALEAGVAPDIATAIAEHYAPLGPSDTVPTAPVSVAVSLAEKIEKLCGFWAVREKPTGSKDPYALRRAGLALLRLTLDRQLNFSLSSIISFALELLYDHAKKADADIYLFGSRNSDGTSTSQIGQTHWGFHPEGMDWVWGFPWPNDPEGSLEKWRNGELSFSFEYNYVSVEMDLPKIVIPNLLAFLHDRLKVHLRDEGIRHDVIDACLAMPGNDDLTLLVKRARALSDFLKTEDGTNLLQGFKRANNILQQAEEADGVEYSYGADIKFADTVEERALFVMLDAEGAKIETAMASEDFGAAMSALARLRAPIDAFFDAVQVNADSEIIRRNRLNLLSRIRRLCLDVADLTRIEG